MYGFVTEKLDGSNQIWVRNPARPQIWVCNPARPQIWVRNPTHAYEFPFCNVFTQSREAGLGIHSLALSLFALSQKIAHFKERP